MFAYREGILDSYERSTGIVSDKFGAYAIVLNGQSEISCPNP